MIKLKDNIYGEFEISEPVLLDILNSPALNRLKGVMVGGYYPGQPEISGKNTRYGHSTGVLLLLRRFNAKIEEQIAGLLHDVSHSAFSHAIDYMGKDKSSQKSQDHQDSIHNKFVRDSELSAILKKHGFDINYILDDANFPLKENNLPDICADRIDYSLKDGVEAGFVTLEQARYIVDKLTVHNGSFIFSERDAAQDFADNFTQVDENTYSSFAGAVKNATNGKMLGYAIEKEYIQYADLYKLSDDEIISKLQSIKDDQLQKYFATLNLHSKHFKVSSNEEKYDTAFSKIRRVNPCFLENNKLTRLSEVNQNYAKMLANAPKFVEYKIKEIF